MKSKYIIEIKVVDEENNEIIGQRAAENIEVANLIINDIPKWIENYEKINFGICEICKKEFHKNNLSLSEEQWFCQDCLEGIMSGEIKLKDV